MTSTPTLQAGLWKPLVLRGALALIFGLLTVFWPDVPELVRALATGVYLLSTGVAVYFLAFVIREGLPQATISLRIESIIFVVAGALLLFFQSTLWYIAIVAFALGLGSLIEIVLWIRFRRRTILSRDWCVVGVVGLGTTVLLPLIGFAADRAPAGVAGGSAVIIGIALVLAGLTYRHDVAAAQGEKGSLLGVE